MADTNFINHETVITAEWANDVNDLVYNATIPTGSFSPGAANKILYSTGATTVAWSATLPTGVVSASISGNGLVSNSAGTLTGRTLTAPAAGISVTNGDGVSGNPTLALADDLAGLEGIASTGLAARTASNTWTTRSIVQPAAGLTVTNGDGVSGDPTIALANDLSAVEGLASTGLAARTASDTWTTRSITQPAAGITVTNGDGVAGNPTLALADDLAGLEGMSGTGLVTRTASNTYAQRTLTGTTNRVTVTNGDGVSDNPTVDISSSYAGQNTITTVGTVTTGTWNATPVTEVYGGTGQSTFAQGDLLYASGANTLAKLAKNTSSTRYLSNTGTSNNPAWAQVDLTNGVTGTLPVTSGGTGITTATAYGVLCAGTTATGAFQSVASVGSSGQVLTSNGAGALPTFQAVPSGTFVLVSTGTASSSSSIDFTGLSSTYFAYKILIVNLVPATNNVELHFRTSTDNGSTFDSSAGTYAWSSYWFNSTSGASTSTSDTKINMADLISTTANRKFSAEVIVFNPSASDYCRMIWRYGVTDNNGAFTGRVGQGVRLSTTAVNAIRFLMSSGNIASGTFKLYGMAA